MAKKRREWWDFGSEDGTFLIPLKTRINHGLEVDGDNEASELKMSRRGSCPSGSKVSGQERHNRFN